MGSQTDDLRPGELEGVLARMSTLIGGAVARLEPDDLRARVAYCRSTGDHGSSFRCEGDKVVVYWAGRPLVEIDRATLAAVVPDDPQQAES